MSKKVIIIWLICILIFPNLPLINKYIALKVDNDYYRYSNNDGSYTFCQDFSFKSPGFSTFGFKRFIEETSPSKENRTLYRLYRINPLCFWRWKKYFIESRHFDYMDWKGIEERRNMLNKETEKLSRWQDFQQGFSKLWVRGLPPFRDT